MTDEILEPPLVPETLRGFPAGHFAAIMGALSRGDEPPTASIEAIEQWRIGRYAETDDPTDLPLTIHVNNATDYPLVVVAETVYGRVLETGEVRGPLLVIVKITEGYPRPRRGCSWCDDTGELGPPDDRYVCPCPAADLKKIREERGKFAAELIAAEAKLATTRTCVEALQHELAVAYVKHADEMKLRTDEYLRRTAAEAKRKALRDLLIATRAYVEEYRNGALLAEIDAALKEGES